MCTSKLDSFLKFHNISETRLSELAGVSKTTVHAYKVGELKNWKLKTRIEIAMQVIDDYGLIWDTATRDTWEYENDTNEVLDRIAKRYIHRIVVMELG